MIWKELGYSIEYNEGDGRMGEMDTVLVLRRAARSLTW